MFERILEEYNLKDNFKWKYIGDGHMNKSWAGFYHGRPEYVLREYARYDKLSDLWAEHSDTIQG